MQDAWRAIWNRRKAVTGGLDGDWKHVFLELKRLNGYDVMEGGISLDAWLELDAVYANSLLHYLTDNAYAEQLMERMLEKTTGAIGLIDLHDRDKEEEFHAYRRSVIPDYDARYKGLSNLFFPRSFFEDFARAHDLRIVFTPMQLRGYWNAPFVFNCFMYRE